jgi:hypothetical protein
MRNTFLPKLFGLVTVHCTGESFQTDDGGCGSREENQDGRNEGNERTGRGLGLKKRTFPSMVIDPKREAG